MIETQQILIPKKVHIGDTAELRCTFTADSQELSALVSQGTASLPLSVFSAVDSEDFEILTVSVSPAGVNYYQISITFIPWKSGAIKLPDLSVADIDVALKPVDIVSLTKQFNTSSLKESNAPLLLPGTAYKLWGSVIAGILLLILSINLIVKRKKVSFFMKNRILQLKYRKNKRLTIKKLRKLANCRKGKNGLGAGGGTSTSGEGTSTAGRGTSTTGGGNCAGGGTSAGEGTSTAGGANCASGRAPNGANCAGISDSNIAEEFQHIMRKYLEFRFGYPFTNVVTADLMNVFNDITQMVLSEMKYEAFGEIVSAFIRTDYIRYGGGANSDGVFLNGELQELVENIIGDIEKLEGDDKKEDVDA